MEAARKNKKLAACELGGMEGEKLTSCRAKLVVMAEVNN
jgi:hypothetical protein